MDEKTIKIKYIIEEIIYEHDLIWKDISCNFKNYRQSAGYNCFNLAEKDIITIASGLSKKVDLI